MLVLYRPYSFINVSINWDKVEYSAHFLLSETLSDETCNAVNLHIENGYGMALVEQCLTSDPTMRWANNCSVTFECLSGYKLNGTTNKFICENGRWMPDDVNKPSCK